MRAKVPLEPFRECRIIRNVDNVFCGQAQVISLGVATAIDLIKCASQQVGDGAQAEKPVTILRICKRFSIQRFNSMKDATIHDKTMCPEQRRQ